MRPKLRGLVAVLVSLAAIIAAPVAANAAPPHHHKHHHHHQKLPPHYRQWQKVTVCEEGGWYVPGGNYPDPMGIDATNWAAAHGPALPTGELTRRYRILAVRGANRFLAYLHRLGIDQPIPDQNGCDGSW